MTTAPRRLMIDISNIMRTPLHDNGIFYIHNETNFMEGYAMIIGPENTPYFGGYYFFKFDFPSDYPFQPPKVTFLTSNGITRFNPNLYVKGKVCISILNTWHGEKWSSCQSIRTVLLTLCTLLNESPLDNEPGYDYRSPEFIPYNETIEYMNISFAICDQLSNTSLMHPFLHQFLPTMKDIFIKNYDKLLQFIKNKSKEEKIINIPLYTMSTLINYSELEHKLNNVKNMII